MKEWESVEVQRVMRLRVVVGLVAEKLQTKKSKGYCFVLWEGGRQGVSGLEPMEGGVGVVNWSSSDYMTMPCSRCSN